MSDASFVVRVPDEKPSLKEILRALPTAFRFFVSVDKWAVVFVVCTQLLNLPIAALTVISIKRLTDAVTVLDATRTWQWVIVVCAVSLFSELNNVIRNNLQDVVRYKLQIGLTERWIEKMQNVPYARLEDPRFQSLAQVFDRKSHMMTGTAMSLVWIFSSFFECLGLFTVVVFLPWPATVIFILAQLIRIYFIKRTQKWSWETITMETREGKRTMYHQSVLTNLKSLFEAKQFQFAGVFLKRWKKGAQSLLQARIRTSRSSMLTGVYSDGAQLIGFIIGLVIVVNSVLSGQAAISVVVIFITSIMRFQGQISSLAWNITWFMSESVFLPTFKAFFEVPSESDRGRELATRPLQIVFEDVWFRYPGTEEDILRGVSFSFSQGDHLALVGLNGAGKSTLLKLLMRVYEPTRGSIRVNGTELSSIRSSAWRKALAVLTQNIQWYDDPLEEQILYGDLARKKNSKRLTQAIATSSFRSVLDELPKGLTTHVGKQYAEEKDEAIELSGGQNQLLGIARTLYRDARVYIFDEPTSAVDAEKEEQFFERLGAATTGKIVIFVSHRFSVLRRASRILVMDQGRIIEDGTHEELLAKEGRYAELFTLQAKMYQ